MDFRQGEALFDFAMRNCDFGEGKAGQGFIFLGG